MSLPTRVTGTQSPFNTIQKDFDAMLTRMFTPVVTPAAGGRLAPYFAAPSYGVDVREDADHLYVEAELPGFKKDEIEITVENQVLAITAERKQPAEPAKGELLLNERRQSRFARTFKLPQTVSEQAVHATLVDGVLAVTLDKREESKPRKIVVQ